MFETSCSSAVQSMFGMGGGEEGDLISGSLQ